MSPQETQVLQDFLNQLVQAKGIAKDPQADALIASAVAQQPDATYLLVQRALLVEQALNAAKAQIATLENQLKAAQQTSSGFLDAGSAWGRSAGAVSRPSTPMAAAPTPQQYQAPQYQTPMQGPAATPSFLGGAGSVLGTVAATAAGVAGGAFLFQGIEHMMGHNVGAGFGSNFLDQHLGMAPLARPVENTTINNYYDSDTSSNDSADDTDSSLLDDSSYDDSADDGSLI